MTSNHLYTKLDIRYVTILDCALSSVFSLIPFVQIKFSNANLTESVAAGVLCRVASGNDILDNL